MKSGRIFRVFLILLFAAACLSLFFIVQDLNLLRVRSIDIEIHGVLSNESVILSELEPYYSKLMGTLPLPELQNILEKYHEIDHVQIARRFPDSLLIHIFPRKPVALVYTSSGAIFLDPHGYPFPCGENTASAIPSFTVVPVETQVDFLNPEKELRWLYKAVLLFSDFASSDLSHFHHILSHYPHEVWIIDPERNNRIRLDRNLTEKSLYRLSGYIAANTLIINTEFDLRFKDILIQRVLAGDACVG